MINEHPGRVGQPTKRWYSIVGMALAFAFAMVIGGLLGPVADNVRDAQVGAQSTAPATTSLDVVAEEAVQAVVTITVFVEDIRGFDQLLPVGTGSGFILDVDGNVVTNHHVVEGGDFFEVTFFDGRSATGELVGSDAFQDVAVLKLALDAGQTVPGTLFFGDSDLVGAGDSVLAIGNPFGENANTVSEGVVRNIDRALNAGGGRSLPNLVQHDAEIYPGNSGGPLVSANGEVIGINVAKSFSAGRGMSSMDGAAFAIASNDARVIVNELIADGSFERGFIGINAQATRDGILVDEILDGGPAELSALQAGDLIVGIAGVPGDGFNETLDTILFERSPGDLVTLEVVRDGQFLEIDLILGERPEVSVQ